MASWVGVDVGGTFTDFILFDDVSGMEFSEKLPSTPGDPSEAIIRGIRALLSNHQLDSRAVAQVAHGTTVATNTLIERRGAKVALITTKGFRDVLEIARQRRPVHFDMYLDFPPAVVPRWRRFEIAERILADGSVRTPLTEDEVENVVARALQSGAEAFAVSLLFSYIRPDHEERIGRALAAASPNAHISLSSVVHPEFREYERTSTTTINAYLQPLMARYLQNLSDTLASEVPSADVVVSQSTAGLMSIETAQRVPIRTALSGPAAGVLGAVSVAKQAGFHDVITFDMGGTSADVALVRELEPAQSHDQLVGGLPIRLPSVEISSIGAGGGSIAWFDRDGAMKVGPRSAGASPGPACYGLGGDLPTVTDANLLLGRLSPEGLLGGAMKLDSEAARYVLQPLAKRLSLSLEHGALGLLRIVVTNMARVIRAITVEKGYDPRDLSLLAYGGAGPLHASAVAASMDIRRVIIPLSPGLLCAAGLNASNLKEDFIRTARVPLDDTARERLGVILRELHATASEWVRRERIRPDTAYIRVALDIRYVGQNFELEIPLQVSHGTELPELPSLEALRGSFFTAHERTYGFFNPEAPVEVLNCRLVVGGRRHPLREIAAAAPTRRPGEPRGRRAVWFSTEGAQTTPIYRREDLAPGQQLSGPIMIEQMDTTTAVHPSDTLTVDRYGNLIIEVAR